MIDRDNAAFIQGGVSIIAASVGAGNDPRIARAVGCRVSRDRRRLTVLLSTLQSAELLEAIRASRAIAVVFTQPSTHRTLQLKGHDAEVGPATRADGALVRKYTAAFVAELGGLGYREEFVRSLLSCAPQDIVQAGFTISAAFVQTPGPRAGAPLRFSA